MIDIYEKYPDERIQSSPMSNSQLSSPIANLIKDLTDSQHTQKSQNSIKMAEVAASLMIQASGDDLERDGVQRTPERFGKAWHELTSGYRKTAREAIGKGIFDAESSGLVSVKDIEFYSLCEHHMLPFWGRASVGYYPSKKILGLSKLPRVVEVFARRLQVQERLTQEIGQAIQELIRPRAVAVRVQACHLCMMMRGVQKQSTSTITEAHFGFENITPREQDRLWNAL